MSKVTLSAKEYKEACFHIVAISAYVTILKHGFGVQVPEALNSVAVWGGAVALGAGIIAEIIHQNQRKKEEATPKPPRLTFKQLAYDEERKNRGLPPIQRSNRSP
ncbi:MAG: hypothetical protein FWF24_02070 [Alphaproteobacteria bacterium]|nr:hypothetical protein [Alphaproteobacteria bacterium]